MAQPSSGGAVQTIGGIAKSLAPERPERPAPSRVAAEYHELELACRVSASDLAQGCQGMFTCGIDLEVPCVDKESISAGPLPGGIDFVAAGTGLRNASSGSISLRGALPDAQPVAAWLYWGAIAVPAEIPTLGWIEFAGKLVPGELVGTSKQPCWSSGNLFASWRADVSEFIAPKVNGDYEVRLDSVSVSQIVDDGRDPWHPVDKTASLRYNGASLVVVYWHQDLPSTSWFFLHEGPHLLIGDASFRHELGIGFGAASEWVSAREARQARLGGDGQTHGERRQPVAPFITLIGGENESWNELRGSNSAIDRHHDWQGTDGGPINQLWDTQITSLPSSMLGSNTVAEAYWLRYESQKQVSDPLLYDCVNVVAHVLSLH